MEVGAVTWGRVESIGGWVLACVYGLGTRVPTQRQEAKRRVAENNWVGEYVKGYKMRE